MYKKISLNGNWQIESGDEKPGNFKHKCEVPALVDVAKPAFNWKNYNYFWYRKEFRIPPELNFNKIYLQLEQVQYGTEIWLNNQMVGGDIPCYTSQEFDLTDYVKMDGSNELLVRVGKKETLPAHSAVGNDFEKLSFIPGIWGDIWLHFYGEGRIEWTRILPDIERDSVNIYSEIKNLSNQKRHFNVEYQVIEKKAGILIGKPALFSITLSSYSISVLEFNLQIPEFKLWSPDNPFMYLLEIHLKEHDSVCHSLTIPFGMRKFEIRDGHFFLNGSRRVLMGSNIAFHRMLSDDSHGTLPWNPDWIKKVLVDIPKAHNMFFFRFHLGHAYNKWYDIADENGIMLQDEWMFWTSTGSLEQIGKEFGAWIKENCNHPSIVIWDALNESTDSRITGEIIPRLKELDPSRPWEMVDFGEDHPYIYSLGSILNGKKFGFSRSIFDWKNSPIPAVVNEYLWWWLDRRGAPTELTEIILERWLGRNPDKEQILQHQSFLASELTELWRRLDIDAILPFVYLSAGYGPTANWFWGTLDELRPKPILAALKKAFSPVGVSIELWDRHFLQEEERALSVYVFNDTGEDQNVRINLFFENQPERILFEKKLFLSAGEHIKMAVHIIFPEKPGPNILHLKITNEQNFPIANSRKKVTVFHPVQNPVIKAIPALTVCDPSGEIHNFLKKHCIPLEKFPVGLEKAQIVLTNGWGIKEISEIPAIELYRFMKKGGILILQEPEFEIADEARFSIFKDIQIKIQYREDPERGGYDSYVFPSDPSHFLWKNIGPDHLKIFNGALGGEIVSQHSVRPTIPYHSVADCNIGLRTPAVLEIPYEKGWIIISRIQVRGRLLQEESSAELYGRRYDPVAEQYLWNLITGYVNRENYHLQIQEMLSKIKIYVRDLRASTGQVYDMVNGSLKARWASKQNDPQWIWIDFGRLTKIEKVTIQWEAAYNKNFEIFHSHDNQNWNSAAKIDSKKKCEENLYLNLETHYIRINYAQINELWNYSIWEIDFE